MYIMYTSFNIYNVYNVFSLSAAKYIKSSAYGIQLCYLWIDKLS